MMTRVSTPYTVLSVAVVVSAVWLMPGFHFVFKLLHDFLQLTLLLVPAFHHLVILAVSDRVERVGCELCLPPL